MKTAIVTSARIFSEENNYYIDNGVNIVVKRYQRYFGDITAFGMDGSDKGMRPSTASKLEAKVVILGTRNDLLLGKDKKTLEKELPKFDLVILRVPSHTCDRAAKIARMYNIPYFVEVIGDAFDSLWYHSLKAKPFAFGSYFRTKKTIYNADYALYVSQQYLQNKYPCKNPSVGVSDCSIISPTEELVDNRIANMLRKDYSSITIMNAAAIDVRYKGQEYIIKAIPILNKEGVRVRFLIAGNGDKSYLAGVAKEAGVSDQVFFLGSLSHEKVMDHLDEADFYIQSSLTEGFPRAVVEGLSRGCVCIGSRVGGITELIEDRFLVVPKSAQEIAERIKLFINMSATEKEDLIRRNFTHASEFTPDKLDKKRDAYYKAVLKEIEGKASGKHKK